MAADTVRIGGTGAGVITVAAMAEPASREVGVALWAVPSLGSTGGMRALAAGKLDMAILGREMTADEAWSGARVVAEIRTPFVFVTSRATAPAMSAAEIVHAFADPRARWHDGQLVGLVLRQRSDADATLLNRSFPGMEAAVELARRRPEIPVSMVDDDNAETAERTQGSLATMSYSQLMLERRQLRAIAVDGVAPSLPAFEAGSYRHGRPFYLVVPAAPAAGALRFVALLQSERGRELLRDVHCVAGVR